MQFRYLVMGLLLAAAFAGGHWVWNQPGITPVRLPGAGFKVPEAVRGLPPDEQRGLELPVSEPTVDIVEAESEGLPPLNESDTWFRDQLADVATPWLAETELIRTAATVLENASRGELPRKFLGFLAPTGKFGISGSGAQRQMDPASFERYDSFVGALEMLPPERAAEFFRTIEPLLAEAVRELGTRSGSPRELAYLALNTALATPRTDGTDRLVQPKVLFKYADEELESLLPLQKQLLRMGPDNLERVRIWLEDFGLALSPTLNSAMAPGAS